MRRFARNVHGCIALLALVGAFLEATQANYAGAAWQAFWFLVSMRFHLDALQLDRDRWLIGIDLASGPDRLATWRRLP